MPEGHRCGDLHRIISSSVVLLDVNEIGAVVVAFQGPPTRCRGSRRQAKRLRGAARLKVPALHHLLGREQSPHLVLGCGAMGTASETTRASRRRHLGVVVAIASICALFVSSGAIAASPVRAAGHAVRPHGFSLLLAADRGQGSNSLNWVSCLPTTCFAVGWGLVGNFERTLIEQRRAHGWAVLPSPNVASGENLLQGVDCKSVTFCMAVGWHRTTSGFQPVIERWNGAGWALLPNPATQGPANAFNAVSCASTTMCVAVGRGFGTPNRTLVAMWNGRAWTVAHTPNPTSADDVLSAISCPTTTACTAVGTDGNGSVEHTLVLQWRGAGWTIAPSRDHGSSPGYLNGVSCLSATSCRAVGQYKQGVYLTLIEAWNGHTWAIQPSPNVNAATLNNLSDVACTSSNSCVAVGSSSTGSMRNLVERWNGHTWTIGPVPNAPGGDNSLSAISCVSATSCTSSGVLSTSPDMLDRTFALVGH